MAFQRAQLHALLVSPSYITYHEAMSTFPQWMAAAARAFGAWLESGVTQDFAAFQGGVRAVLGLHPRHHGTRLGWPQRAMAQGVCRQSCSRECHGLARRCATGLPTAVVLPSGPCGATVLDMEESWWYDQRLRRVIPLAHGRSCMAVLIGPQPLALVQGDDVPSRVAGVLLSLLDGDDNASAETRLTLDPLHLEPVVEAQSGGQRLVIA